MKYIAEFPCHPRAIIRTDKATGFPSFGGMVWFPSGKIEEEHYMENGQSMIRLIIPAWLYDRNDDKLKQIPGILIECFSPNGARVDKLTFKNQKP